MAIKITKLSSSQLNALFEQFEDVTTSPFKSEDENVRNAPMCVGQSFHFVSTNNLLATREATINGENRLLFEMIDADNNPISVNHLVRRRNGIEDLFDNESKARAAVRALVDNIYNAGEDGITVQIASIEHYPADHATMPNAIRFIKFKQIKGNALHYLFFIFIYVRDKVECRCHNRVRDYSLKNYIYVYRREV